MTDHAAELYEHYGWRLAPGRWRDAEIDALRRAGAALETWLLWYTVGTQAACAAIRRVWGGTTFNHANMIGRVLRRNHTESERIYFFGAWYARSDPRYVPVHELAHVLDNRSQPVGSRRGPWLLRDADMYGGGIADVLARRLNGVPERCRLRFFCRRAWAAEYLEPPVTPYAHMGPSEDFADTFALAVLSPDRMRPGTRRAGFIQELGRALAGQAAGQAEAPLRTLVTRASPRDGRGVQAAETPHKSGWGGRT